MDGIQANSTSSSSQGIEPLLITMEDLQRVIGCGKTTAFALTNKTTGKIETVLQGRRRLPVWESVKAYVQSLREAA